MQLSQEYYALPDSLTDLSDFKDFTTWLSADPRVIFQVAQGLIVHDMWIERYGIHLKPEHKRTKCTPSASEIITQAAKLREVSISLALPRSPEERVVACCREFTVLATALFRAKGIPARARCGFATYLAKPGLYEDHWVCEYWNGNTWIAIDPQIDPFQQSVLQNYANTETDIEPEYKQMLLSLDPLNVSNKHFINAGIAWNMMRDDEVSSSRFGIGADPKEFGLKSLYGAWFVRGQLLRDFASLNKVEAVPYLVRLEFGEKWDAWRLVSARDDELSEKDWELLDTLAELCTNPDERLGDLQELFRRNQELAPLL